MWERGFCLPGLLLQREPRTQSFSHRVGGRGGNRRPDAKSGLYSSLLREGQLPRTHLLSFLTPTDISHGRPKEKGNLVTESVSQNLLIYFQELERACLHDFHFRPPHFGLRVSKDYIRYRCAFLPKMKRLLTVTYFFLKKCFGILLLSQNTSLVETSPSCYLVL